MNDKRLPVGLHLVELRRRLTWAVAAVLVCTVVSFVFHQQILTLLMKPAQGFAAIPSGKPIYTDLTEFIGVAMKVSLLGGLVLSFPFVLYQIVRFVAPGLSGTERRYLYLLVPGALIAFLLGAAFGYRVLFPPAVEFLLSFGSDVATPYIRIGNYTSLMLTLLFWMGIVFETPIVAFFLSKIGVVTPRLMSQEPALRCRGRFPAGRHYHADVRPDQPDPGCVAYHRYVRAWDTVCKVGSARAAGGFRRAGAGYGAEVGDSPTPLSRQARPASSRVVY